jgi:hypothetical protein
VLYHFHCHHGAYRSLANDLHKKIKIIKKKKTEDMRLKTCRRAIEEEGTGLIKKKGDAKSNLQIQCNPHLQIHLEK